MFRIEVPNKNYTGETAGVTFVNGIGFTENLTDTVKDYFNSIEAVVTEDKKKK